MANLNIQDAAAQEKVRRGSHAYVPEVGRHGAYVARDYLHQEFPKFMDRTPAPKRKRKQTDEEFQALTQEWEDTVNASVVNNKAEETKWLAENKPAEKKAKVAA